ncbi:MAG TPA: relaxase/mobilization nuclease domain-containing protein, partial [Acidocella sp.]|nr:relaxase/mobilization nuclease domain-containing protein [Acidocella sp.]
ACPMIGKIITAGGGGVRAKGGAVFGRVAEYIENKPAHERGAMLAADCVLSAETAAVEMEAVAHEAPRCKEPALHVVLAWQSGEHPTEAQQREAVARVLVNMQDRDGRDMSGHQWVAVLHKDTDHDHLHVLINRVDPETARPVSPAWSQRSLHKAAREIEAAQGWAETRGLMTWNEEQGRAVPTPAAELAAQRVPEPAARMEAHQTAESLTGYVQRSGVARELGELLQDGGARWGDVQSALGRHGLELHRGEKGGYTVSDGTTHAKASNALRGVFSGREARARLESLGEWAGPARGAQQAEYSPMKEPAKAERAQPGHGRGDQAAEKRATRREERAKERAALWERYQDEKRDWTRSHKPPAPEVIKDGFRRINAELKAERQEIRARTSRGSNARLAKESVAAFRAMEKRDQLRVELAAERQSARPPSWQAWVTDKAQEGDRAAQGQLRGWQYAKERAPEGQRQKLERSDARQPTRNEGATAGVDWRRRWFLGGVEYKIDGKAAVIDKGTTIKLVDGRGADNRALALAMGLQAEKRGGNVAMTGNEAFKARCVDVAAERGLSLRFEDPRMQRSLEAKRQQQGPQQGQQQRRPTLQAIHAQQRQQTEQKRALSLGLGLLR